MFIASFGDEANRIVTSLPPGHGHVCTDTSKMPSLFKEIFTTEFDVKK